MLATIVIIFNFYIMQSIQFYIIEAFCAYTW